MTRVPLVGDWRGEGENSQVHLHAAARRNSKRPSTKSEPTSSNGCRWVSSRSTEHPEDVWHSLT